MGTLNRLQSKPFGYFLALVGMVLGNQLTLESTPHILDVDSPPLRITGIQIIGIRDHPISVIDYNDFLGLPLRGFAICSGETGSSGDAQETRPGLFFSVTETIFSPYRVAAPIWIRWPPTASCTVCGRGSGSNHTPPIKTGELTITLIQRGPKSTWCFPAYSTVLAPLVS